MVNIREYQTGDAINIYRLFSENTHYKRDATFWVWINRLLSDEKSIIVVAEVNGTIVGHYAILPRKCLLTNEVECKCGLGIHAFVKPDFRNVVSIFSITSLAYSIASTNGYDFIYGFPNSNYRLIQEKIERWKKISLFNAYVKPLTVIREAHLKFEWDIIINNDIGKYLLINELLESFDSDQIHFLKSLNYFLNRYINHPQKLYNSWILRQNGELVGLIVIKRFSSDQKRIHILDYLIKTNSLLSDLIDDFEAKFANDADVSVQWPMSKHFSELLIEKGYKQNGFDTFFGIKMLSKKAIFYQELLSEFNNWNICMGDSDAF